MRLYRSGRNFKSVTVYFSVLFHCVSRNNRGKKNYTLFSQDTALIAERHLLNARLIIEQRVGETRVITCQTVMEKLDISRSRNKSSRCVGI